MIHLLWTLAVSGVVLALGLSLLLRWLGAAGLPAPCAVPASAPRGCEVSRRELLHVFSAALLFRLTVFLAVAALACLVLYPDTGLSWATDIWKKWDAWHYVGLAELGYTGYWEDGRPLFLVFFPLYPWLVRLVCPLTGHNTMAAGLMVSFLCYSAGCVYLYRLAAWELGKGAARRTVLFLSLFPYAFFFGGVMTEGLFLLTTAAALWHIRRHRWWRAGMWGVLAAMTRMHGLLLIGAAGAELVESLGKFDGRAILRRLPAALGLQLLQVSACLFHQRTSGAFRLLLHLQNALSYYDEAIRIQIWIPTLLLFAAFFALLWYACGRFRSMYTLYAFAYLVLNYSLSWLLSAGRYLSCALPFFLFAAALTEKRPRLTALLAGGMGVGFLANLWCYLLGGQIM